MVVVGEGAVGYLADISAADGRSFSAGAGACLGRHLGVAGDIDVIGVAGCVRIYLAFPRTRAVADASRTGAGGFQIFIRIAARGRHLAAGDFDVVARAVHTAADTGSTLAAHGFYRAAGDLDVSGTAFVLSADACAAACAAAVAALGDQGAVFSVFVLDGQLAGGLVVVLLEARTAAAALQLVVAVQLDGHIAIALDPDGSLSSMDRAAIRLVPAADVPLGLAAAIPFLLAADVNFQVVEGDVHVALGGVDDDGMLLRLVRLSGDDGVGILPLDGLALCDLVRPLGLTRFHGDVALVDVPCFRIGRDARAHHDARDDGGGHAPPECALQSHSTSPFVLCIMQCRRCGSGSPLRGL